jgi:penicillin-binding protein 1C
VQVTPQRFAHTLGELGLPLDHDGDYYGYSLALGSADVPLLALANAYRALANGGVASPVAAPVKATAAPAATPRRVFSPQASYIITDVLSDNNARVRTFGFDNPLATRFFAAVKTGTSKDMRDNWTVGYTPRHTVGVWVGNADGAPMRDVSGVTGAANVWGQVVGYLQQRMPATRPSAPDGLVHGHVAFENSIEPERDEWFLPGTQMKQVALTAVAKPAGRGSARGMARIASPVSGAIYALDPDIPPSRQRIGLDRSNGSQGTWRLDGHDLGGSAHLDWPPQLGHHKLELLDAQGRVADTVTFEVRGLPLLRTAARGKAPA